MIKDTDKQLIWRYIDGECTPEEILFVEEQLQQKPSWKEEYALAQQVHTGLGEQELESPSMRFVQNILDQLPAIKKRIYDPLIAPYVPRVALFTSIILAIILVNLPQGNQVEMRPEMETALTDLTQRTDKLLGIIDYQVFVIVACSFFVVSFLIWFDKRLKNQVDKLSTK